MVNIKMSQTNKMPPTGDNDEMGDCGAHSYLHVTPLKSSGQIVAKGALLINYEKGGLAGLSLPRFKPQTPSSNDREATTQRSLNIRRSHK